MSNYMLPAPLTDTTLTQDGCPADAKAVGTILPSFPKYPNFSNVKKLGTEGTFTISEDGYIQIKMNSNENKIEMFHRIKINGYTVDEGYTSTRYYSYYTSSLFPVVRGDTVLTLSGTEGAEMNTFWIGVRNRV